MPKKTETKYHCNICNESQSQNNHNASHILTNKHKDKCEILKLNLNNETIKEILKRYPEYKKMKKDKLIDKIITDISSVKIVNVKVQEVIECQKYKPSNEIIWEEQSNKLTKSGISIKFMSIIKSAHNLFYKHHPAMGGEKSMRDLMKIFSLIILKPLFNDEKSIIWNKCSPMKEELNNDDYEKYLSYCKHPLNLVKEENPLYEWEDLINVFLIKVIPQYFNNTDSKLNCGNLCFIDVLNSLQDIGKLFDWDNNDLSYREKYNNALSLYKGDMMGDINEYFKNKYGKSGKQLGQFFTPPQLETVISEGLNFIQLLEDSNNPVLADPCMGSASLLVGSYRKNNLLQLHGGEIDSDTIKWAFQSILLNTGEIPNNLYNMDSIINNNIPKGNRITNPPFKISMNYIQEKKAYEDKYGKDYEPSFKDIYPLNMNDPEALFIQNCVYYLGDNCVCAIILPYGKIFESKEKRFVELRKWLYKQVDVIQLMLMPRGVFDYADPLTCTLVFVKRPSTNNLQICKVNKECTKITKLFALTNEDIKTSVEWCPYSFAYYDYIYHELKSKLSGNKVKCRDIFEMIKSKLNSRSVTPVANGEYKLVTGAKYENWHNIDTYDEEGEYMFIGVGGNGDAVPIKYFNGKFRYTNLMGKLEIKKEYKDKINIEYLYNLFLNNQSNLEEYMQKGSSNRTLHFDRLYNMIITIPSYEEQLKSIKTLEEYKQKIKDNELITQKLQVEQSLFIDDYFPKN